MRYTMNSAESSQGIVKSRQDSGQPATRRAETKRNRRKPMPHRRDDGPIRNAQKETTQREADAAMTRREWIQGVAASGAALALSAETGLAATAAVPPLLVGAGKQIITP